MFFVEKTKSHILKLTNPYKAILERKSTMSSSCTRRTACHERRLMPALDPETLSKPGEHCSCGAWEVPNRCQNMPVRIIRQTDCRPGEEDDVEGWTTTPDPVRHIWGGGIYWQVPKRQRSWPNRRPNTQSNVVHSARRHLLRPHA